MLAGVAVLARVLAGPRAPNGAWQRARCALSIAMGPGLAQRAPCAEQARQRGRPVAGNQQVFATHLVGRNGVHRGRADEPRALVRVAALPAVSPARDARRKVARGSSVFKLRYWRASPPPSRGAGYGHDTGPLVAGGAQTDGHLQGWPVLRSSRVKKLVCVRRAAPEANFKKFQCGWQRRARCRRGACVVPLDSNFWNNTRVWRLVCSCSYAYGSRTRVYTSGAPLRARQPQWICLQGKVC